MKHNLEKHSPFCPTDQIKLPKNTETEMKYLSAKEDSSWIIIHTELFCQWPNITVRASAKQLQNGFKL